MHPMYVMSQFPLPSSFSPPIALLQIVADVAERPTMLDHGHPCPIPVPRRHVLRPQPNTSSMTVLLIPSYSPNDNMMPIMSDP